MEFFIVVGAYLIVVILIFVFAMGSVNEDDE